MSQAAIALGEGVFRIPSLGDFINSFAFVESDGSVTLVDCGLARAPARIVRALASIGKHPGDVQRILLTHAHEDHAGGAAAMVASTPAEGVHIHSGDATYVRAGERPPVSSGLFARLRDGRFSPVPVAGELGDGEIVDAAGGLHIVHTPGHTPGHVSLLHPSSGVLITGDAIFNMGARMTWPFAAFCTSPSQARSTARRLADLDYRTVAFTHGPEIRDHGREAIRSFLAAKP